MRSAHIGAALVAAALVAAATAAPAMAQQSTAGSVPAQVTVPATLPSQPSDFSLSAGDAINSANEDARIVELRTANPGIHAAPSAKGDHKWEVTYSTDSGAVAIAVVDADSGEVNDVWTGDQLAWPMARGYSGQFGHLLNAPYVWIPLALIFLAGLFDFKRPGRIAHVDLLVLLSFGISQMFFDDAQIGLSVPLAYPPLLYLLARMVWIGFKGPGPGLRPSAPVKWLAIATIFLCAFRVSVNVADSGVIDVGYAGVIGAEKISHGKAVYGEGVFPEDNPSGDTYGPANYLAYVPFEQALPWSSGHWDDLPAAHAAAIFFDLAAIAGLLVLGRRLRNWDLGVLLAFAWAAFPYTDYALQSNSNDALVGALVIWALALFSKPAWRAVLLATAGAAKFGPLALAPLFASGERGVLVSWKEKRFDRAALLAAAYFASVLFAALAVFFIYPAIEPGLLTTWKQTIATQMGRHSPFSIWGQVGLEPLHKLVTLAVGAGAVALFFVPRKRSLAQIAALAAAVTIAGELTLAHWFYLYIPWFLGPLLAAVAMSSERGQPSRARAVEGDGERAPTAPSAAPSRSSRVPALAPASAPASRGARSA